MMVNGMKWALTIVFLQVCWGAIAQVYPITDRSFAYATAYTISQGHFQLETGYFGVWDLNKEELPDLTGYSGLLRYGITDAVEVRGRLGRLSFDLGDEVFSGWDGLELSTKIAVLPEGKFLPSAGLLFELDIPWAGKEGIRESTLSPSTKFIFEKYINSTFIIGGNFGWQWLSGNEALTNYSISLRTALTEEIALYTEFYGFNNSEIGARDFVDAALEFWVLDGIALDLVIGWGVSDNADGGFWSIGASFYF